MNHEKETKPASGYLMLAIILVIIALGIIGIALYHNPWFVALIIIGLVYSQASASRTRARPSRTAAAAAQSTSMATALAFTQGPVTRRQA